jgi:hypothetical protein
MLDEEVITLRRAAAFTRVWAAAFSRLQAKEFSWMRTVQHPWEETREEGAQDVVGEAGVSDPASERAAMFNRAGARRRRSRARPQLRTRR